MKRSITFSLSVETHAEIVALAAEKYEGSVSEFARVATLRLRDQLKSHRNGKGRGKGLSRTSDGQESSDQGGENT